MSTVADGQRLGTWATSRTGPPVRCAKGRRASSCSTWHHAQTGVTYDPATDRSADWNYSTDLNSPTGNGYSRGCGSITMCRKGS